MVITRKSSILLNLFNIRVIVNGSDIYQIDKGGAVVIGLTSDCPRIVVTNGFHFSPCFEVPYKKLQVNYLNVDCAIDDNLLAAGSFAMVLIYAIGLTSGLLLLKIGSFVPILYFLYMYYINRKNFIQIRISNQL
jgi:hypothetical protein